MRTRIQKAYNNFRSNLTPYFFNKVQLGLMSNEDFDKWFNQREETFFAIMDKHNY